MSATGLDVFDKTLQTTNAWVNKIMSDLGPIGISLGMYRRVCVPLVIVCQLASPLIWAELPLLVRGTYYDRYRPPNSPI